MKLYSKCVYTIVDDDALLDADRGSAPSEPVPEGKKWKAVKKTWLPSAHAHGESVPIVFADAKCVHRWLGWGVLVDVDVEPIDIPPSETRYRFQHLRPLLGHRRSDGEFRLLETGNPLSDKDIRPYRHLRTPPFLSGQTNFDEQPLLSEWLQRPEAVDYAFTSTYVNASDQNAARNAMGWAISIAEEIAPDNWRVVLTPGRIRVFVGDERIVDMGNAAENFDFWYSADSGEQETIPLLAYGQFFQGAKFRRFVEMKRTTQPTDLPHAEVVLKYLGMHGLGRSHRAFSDAIARSLPAAPTETGAARAASYVARICWNSQNWRYPTGEAAKIEHDDTYNAQSGFGHEEWLFNFQWILDGWKYAFLQPVNRSLEKVQGETLDIRVYTIKPGENWWYVGHLHRCEVLHETVAADARKEFQRRGWLKSMMDQVRHVGGNVEGLRYPRATLLFNIRFRPADAELYDSMIPVGERDPIRKLRRYNLVSVDETVSDVGQVWASRVAATRLRPTGTRQRAEQGPTKIDLVHNQLQNELHAALVKRYGKAAVALEEGFVDIKLRRPDGTTLIEVKSDCRPRYAIREAIGQLLEYAFECEERGESVRELVVAGPGELGPRDQLYLKHLREGRGFPIRYVQFRSGISDVKL